MIRLQINSQVLLGYLKFMLSQTLPSGQICVTLQEHEKVSPSGIGGRSFEARSRLNLSVAQNAALRDAETQLSGAEHGYASTARQQIRSNRFKWIVQSPEFAGEGSKVFPRASRLRSSAKAKPPVWDFERGDQFLASDESCLPKHIAVY